MTALARTSEARVDRCVCTHCGLDVPAGLVRLGERHQFCCAGCDAAYAVIHQGGLERYYAMRERVPAGVQKPAARAYDEFDDPAFHSLYCEACGGEGLRTTQLLLEGVHCAACVWLLEKLPRLAPGVIEARLDVQRSLLRVVWNEEEIRLSRIARTLASIGYAPHPARGVSVREVRTRNDRASLIRIAVAGACAGNVMLLFIALYAGLFEGMEAGHTALLRWASMGISIIAIAWPGGVFFRGAIASIRARALTLDVPIAMGLGLGALWGVVNTVRGEGDLYFDSIAALVFFLLVGRHVQSTQQRAASDSVEMLFSLTPTSATVVDEGGTERVVSVASLVVGQVVLVRAGEVVPVDGIVEQGEGTIDRSMLTGESIAARVGAGAEVHAGTTSVSGVLRVRVSATGERTRMGRLMRLIEEGSRRKGGIVALADRFAGWFIGIALTLAFLTIVLWMGAGWGVAIGHAIALLIATCPCGLGLATPLTMSVALGQGARRGYLIKSGLALESLAMHPIERGLMLLDKTGTLTYGRTRLVSWWQEEGVDVRGAVADVEAFSAHHAAKALAEGLAAYAKGAVLDAQETQGRGLMARLHNGSVLGVGAASFVRACATSEASAVGEQEKRAIEAGLAPTLVSLDGRIVAVAGLGDAIRDDAAASVRALRDRGWEVRIASGDHPAIVRSVGEALGLDASVCLGGLTPEDKLAIVRAELARGRRVVMVGDGTNDGPALAESTVGISVHGGAEASLQAADIATGRPGLGAIVELVDGARRTRAALLRCIGVSIFYNVVVAGLAMAGFVSPLAAAILMPAASLSVLLVAVRSRSFPRERATGRIDSQDAPVVTIASPA